MQVYPELKLLGFAVIIGLVQLAWAAIAAQPQRGRAWNVGPRDEPCPLTGMAKLHHRAAKDSGYVRAGLQIKVPKLGIGVAKS